MLFNLVSRFRSQLGRATVGTCISALVAATCLQAQPVASVAPLSINFGTVSITSTSSTQTLTFTFTTAGTLGSYKVLSSGNASGDFAAAATSSCPSQSYAKNATCTVDVTFTPTYPGLRYGAVVLYTSAGAPFATAYVQGVGTGPQVAFLPPTSSTIVNSSLYQPKNVALDSSGNIFAANASKCQILKFSPPSYSVVATISTVVTGSCTSPTVGGQPRGVSVDGAGNVYAITSDTGTVLKASLQSGGSYSAASAILSALTLDTPSSVVADGAGNLFLTDAYSRIAPATSHNRIVMAALQSGGGYTTTTIASTGVGSTPWGLTLDSAGNVYYSDVQKNVVVKLANSSWASTQVASGLLGPYGLAVDAAGDVYIADTDNGTGNRLIEASPTAGGALYTQTVIPNVTVSNIRGVALDLQGNIYVMDQVKNAAGDTSTVGKIFRIVRAGPPTLTFPDTPVGSTSPAQDVTVQNIGNTQLNISQISLNSATVGGPDTTCTVGGQSLDAVASCILGIQFSPSAAAPNQSGTVTLTDDSLSNNPSTQIINLSGNGIKANQTITFTTVAPTGAAFGTTFPVAATSTSGLPVTLTVDPSSSSVCTLNGGTVTMTGGAGICKIDANQAGNSNYNAAAQVQSSTSAQTGPAAQISFTTQPQNTTAGTSFGVVVKVADGGGTPLNGAAVTLTLQGGAGTLNGTVTATTDVNGQATFSGLNINTAGTYTLRAASGAASGSSVSFVISAATNMVTITASQGDGQQVTVSTAYGAALQALVKDVFGNLVSGASVTFTAPASGASVTFAGTATVTTNASGIATSPALTANSTAGSVPVLATVSGAASPTTFTLTNLAIVKVNQTITFTTVGPASAAFASMYPVAATSTSGLPVTLTVDAASALVCTLSGGIVTITSAVGVCTIDANQTGNANYNPATAVQTSTIAQAGTAALITFTTQPQNSMAGTTFGVVTRVTDAGGNPLNGVSVTLMPQGGMGTLNGTIMATTNASGLATFSGLSINTTGTYTLLATSGSASGVSNSFVISAATSPVTITAIQGDGQQAIAGTAYSGTLQAQVQDSYGNLVSGVSVTFAAPVSGASATFSGTATVTTNASGVAVSPALTANSTAGQVQVLATVPGASSPAPFTLTNLPNTPSVGKLAFVQQPTDTVAAQNITPSVTVQLEDSSGSPVHTAGVPIAIQSNTVLSAKKLFAANSTQNTDANGLATFPNLSIAQVGAYQLQATTAGAASVTSDVFHITAGSPAAIASNGGDSQSAFILTVFGAPLQVTVTDAAGNPVGGVPVTFAAPASGPSGTFGGQPTITVTTDSQGHAQAVITANNTAGDFVVTATSTAVTGSVAFSLTNMPAAATMMKFLQQPSDAVAGQVMAPVTVQVQNSAGGPSNQAGVPVTLAISTGTGTLLGTVVKLTDATGTATFNDLNIQIAGTKRITATSAAQPPVLSNPFVISAATTSLVVTAYQGSGQLAVTGTMYGGTLQALVQDSFGNPASNVSVTFTAPATGASETFSGSATVTTDVNGIATSPTLAANTTAGSFQVVATAAGAASPANFTLTNIANAPTISVLAFVQQPTDTVAGQNITPAVTVQLQDTSGNPVHTAGVQIAIQPNSVLLSKKLFAGNATQATDANGLATFANLSIAQVGSYQLQASAAAASSATSNVFHITAGTPSAITPTGGASQSAFVSTVFAAPLQVTVADAAGNPVSNVPVTFTAPASGASGSFGGQTTFTVNTDSLGHAQVLIMANSTAGSYSITATSAALSGSAAFSLTNTPLSGTVLRFVQQPSNTTAGQLMPVVSVQIQNGSGGSSGQAGVTVTLSLSSGTGTLLGTVSRLTDATGTATFNDLSIRLAGTKQLTATASAQTPALSNSFIISAATSPTTIAAYQGEGQQAVTGIVYSGALQALVQDSFGNALSGVAVTFAAPATGASVTFAGTTTVTTDANGIAVSPALTANSQTGSFQVLATTANAASPATFSLTNISGSRSTNVMAFAQQPTDTAAGRNITPPVTVQLLDSSNNPIHTAGVPISIQSNSVLQANKLFSGTAAQNTDGNGLATFANLSIAQVGTYQLQADTAGTVSVTSNVFHITAGPPSGITPSGGGSQSTFVLTIFALPLQVTVTDAGGNPVSGVTLTFAAPTFGPSATFGGQSSATATTDAQGHAQVVVTANNNPGSYVVTVTSSTVAGSATFSLTNTPLATSMLRFVQQPSNTPSGQVIPPVSVQVQTSSGTSTNQAGVAIVLSLSSGTGTLQGIIVQFTDATGTATFNSLTIGAAGTKQLAASSTGQSPALSNTFQITAGAPSTITAVQGTPQATSILTPFAAQVQAQVLDANLNPVAGASVTFTAPTSGSTGTFTGTPFVFTDSNGIATAPALTANASVGSFTVSGTASGVSNPALFSLTNVSASGTLAVSPTSLTFSSQVNQPAPGGQNVQVTSSSSGPLPWTATTSAPWITVSGSSGTTPSPAAITVSPVGLTAGVYTGAVVFTSSNGDTVSVLVTYTVTGRPALVVAPAALVFATPTNTIIPPSQNLATRSSSGTINYQVTAQISTPGGGSWLSVTPGSGQTTGSVQVSVNPAGLSQGVYSGDVLFKPTDSSINSVAVPVTLLVGCGQGGCSDSPGTIIAVVNAASFHYSGAPAAAMTIFGVALSDSTYQALSYPLPTKLGPTTVTVNGSPVPLYYVSPTQINFQMPAGAPVADVQVSVTGTTSASTLLRVAAPHTSTLTAVDPGLFINAGNRAAALNQDLSFHTSTTPQPAGALILLFITGQGPLSPALQDGMAAPATPLSLISGTVGVVIGGKQAQIVYSGVAPGFAGLSQINAVIPDGLTAGDQPAYVTVNGVASNAGLITVK